MNIFGMGLFNALMFLCVTLSVAEIDSDKDWANKMEMIMKIPDEFQRKVNSIDMRSTGSEYFDIKIDGTPKPKTVHELRPQDIDVLGAMGDSITAANGADAITVAGIITEYRGIAFSIGGEESFNTSITLPNIFRLFNGEVKGYSIGHRRRDRDLWFNVGVPGARSRDMPLQARRLIQNMKNDSRTNYENDWKVVTIFIGGNDLCALDRDEDATPENYIKTLTKALDLLHDTLPRTLVNLVGLMEIDLLREVANGAGSTPACRLVQSLECNYVITANEEQLADIKMKNKEYQTLSEQLINSGRYDTRDDFTVVLQPFLQDTVLPYTENGEVDSSYFAPDCFHFSSKGHAMGALNLWNNMLEPVGFKTTEWGINDLKCPTEEFPYIWTNLNSVGYQPEGSGEDTTTRQPTTKPIPTTFPTKPIITEVIPDWAIAVLCVFGGLFLVQTIALIAVIRSSRKSKKTNSKTDSNLSL